MNKKYLTIIIHVLGWIAFFLIPFLLFNIARINEVPNVPGFHHLHNPRPQPRIASLLVRVSFLVLFFYINLYLLLPRLYYAQKKVTYFMVVFVFLVAAIYFPSLVRAEFMKNAINPPGGATAFKPPNPDFIFGFLHFLIVWFLSSIINLSDRYRLIEQKNKEMKVQKLDAELSYLKAQINPHFLFNTLNNIYALSICQQEQTPEAILKLSAIMRYVTQDATSDTVLLVKELEYLENYISLQQLRNDDKLTVKFMVTGTAGSQVIAPLLLINFIENAFKYGVSNHIPCYVNIDINIANDKLTLNVANKIITAIVKESTFTGTNNTLRRLQLQYAGKHNLTIDETDNLYKVFLQLDLT